MIEIIEVEGSQEPDIIPMSEMKPLQVGVIVDSYSNGSYVVRTASEEAFEVMDLSDNCPNACWSSRNNVKVRLLAKGESILVRLSN